MNIDVKHLQKRSNGVYYFRRRVPLHLVEAVGEAFWKESLGLREGQEAEAAAAVLRLTRQTDRIIREAERRLAAGESMAELAAAAEDWARTEGFLKTGPLGVREAEGVASRWVEDLVERVEKRTGLDAAEIDPETHFTPEEYVRWRTVYEGRRVEVPVTLRDAFTNYRDRHKGGEVDKSAQAAFDQLTEYLGGDVPLSDLRRMRLQDWVRECVEVRGQKPSTVRRRKNALQAMVQRAIEDYELTLANPFVGLKLPEGAGGSSEDRLAFHTVHLALLDQYLSSAKRLKPETRALIALLRATGCRPGEVAGLDWADVVLDAEVQHIRVRANAHRELKTRSSERDIPLAAEAVEAFKLLPASPKRGRVFAGAETDRVSQNLRKVIRAAGIPKSERLVPYSFRHTFIQALRDAHVEPSLQRYLTGHAEQGMSDRYGARRPPLDRLLEAVEAALPLRGQVERSNYREEEWPAEAGGEDAGKP